MGNTDRPLSPHLQVYEPQLTAVLSVFHRASGVFLGVGSPLVVCWLAALAKGPESYANVQGLLGSGIGRTLLLAWVFALFYHLCNGMRHLFWDMGLGFDMNTVYASGRFVVVVAITLTLITFAMAYVIRGGAL